MTDELMTAFDDSLNALAAGESVGAILARYPHLGSELRPMLEAAETARLYAAAAPVPVTAQQRSRARFLTRAAVLREQRRSTARGFLGLAALKTWALANRAVAVTLAFVLGFTLGTYGVLTASAESLPGEPLYGFKRTIEQTQLLLSPNPDAREQLEADFSQRRVEEVVRLLAGAREVEVVFGGLLNHIEGPAWLVAGIRVSVPDEAAVVGRPFAGLYVEVTGISQPDGTVRATRVEVTGLAFIGTVRSLTPTAWLVDSTQLIVNVETEITGAPRIGDQVSVTARRLAAGGWLALHISANLGEPVLTPTPLPTPTRTRPAPSPTPPATATRPVPSPTALPTQAAVEVRFAGVVQTIGAQSWQIGGQMVGITASTEIRDNPQVGQWVEVRALRAADGGLTALRIEGDDSGPSASETAAPNPVPTEVDDDGSGDSGGPGPSASNTPEPADDGSGDDGSGESQEQRWEGTLEAINGSTWVVAGQAVTVSGSTEISDNPQVGDRVEVRATRQGDGSLLAMRIEKKD